jgi:DNA polymerase III delta prime subunit
MDAIKAALEKGVLPESRTALVSSLLQADGTFVPQEGPIWDFKREWPFSYSDDYFAGIARLVCAFANAYGGIIIFGVHDEIRTAGHNKVSPNMDRLQQALDQILSAPVALSCRRYDTGTPLAIDVLLVRPLSSTELPIRFQRPVGSQKANIIWVRQNHEVVSAEPRHVPLLYCRATETHDAEGESSLSGGLPPSPATIKKFVGRLSTIDRVFKWLKQSDEPRTFLYGKGGSGKTTIAYEVAKVLKSEGMNIKTYGGESLDNVVFISAKQRMLNVMSQAAEAFIGLDFSNERELYESILTLCNWTSRPLEEMSLDQLKSEMKELLDLTSNFIVIDDIDTLTTKGLEAGFDFLYGLLWRSKRHSKILYTIRNAPSQSLANSIEVPGLESGDYEEFVRVCADQFKVQSPQDDFINNKLAVISERRPLVIESILALRRTSGNYDRAVHLFEEGSGEDVRSYVFQREWNSLPADNYGRYVLAILALHRDPFAFDDLVALTRYDETRVRDALADIREMFLQVNEVGTETTFQLGALTRAFVFEQSKKLDLYPAIKERVEKYKRNFYPENPILSRLRDRVEGLIVRSARFSDADALRQALNIVNDPTLSPKISEDPRFISLQAYVYACQTPPNLDDARRLFGHVFSMKFEPDIEHIKKWFFVERQSGHGLEQCLRISDFVCQGKKYSDEEKIEFLSRKATMLYNRGRSDLAFSPTTALRDLGGALNLHLSCYTKNCELGSSRIEKSEEYARNTGYGLFDFLVLHSQYDDYFAFLLALAANANIRLDPLEDPISRSLDLMTRDRFTKSEAQKIRGRVEHLAREIERKSQWYDRTSSKRVAEKARATAQVLAQRAN